MFEVWTWHNDAESIFLFCGSLKSCKNYCRQATQKGAQPGTLAILRRGLYLLWDPKSHSEVPEV